MKVWSDDFIHPEDHAAISALEAIPLLKPCVSTFMKLFTEELMHGMNMANKIRLGPQQLPQLYDILPPICDTLGIDEPEFYLEMDPAPNAYAMGETHPSVTITSGLIDLLTPEELVAVVGHECGHIACHHMLYYTMAQVFSQYGLSFLGMLEYAAKPVMYGLLYWARRNELSADRAGAVVTRGPDLVTATMIRLAGGPHHITGKVNVPQFHDQAAQYQNKITQSKYEKLLQALAISENNHPFHAVRVREINEWCATPQFQAVLATEQLKCTSCGKLVSADWKFCRECGATVGAPSSPAPQSKSKKGRGKSSVRSK